MVDGPRFIGNPIHHYEQLESTNSSALDLISKSNPSEGTAIMTLFQTHGKGQYGRKWDSSRGKNILCSIILYPSFLLLKNQFYLNIFSSLAIRKLISGLVKSNVCIKWPNDIYVGDKKISGILINNAIQNNVLKHCVVGIGININQKYFDPAIPNPSSIFIENHVESDLNSIVKKLFNSMEKYYLMLKSGNYSALREAYNEHLYLRNYQLDFSLNKKTKKGIIKEINKEGKLIIQSGLEIKAYDFNEVKYL